jgi:hypothetical protein
MYLKNSLLPHLKHWFPRDDSCKTFTEAESRKSISLIKTGEKWFRDRAKGMKTYLDSGRTELRYSIWMDSTDC